MKKLINKKIFSKKRVLLLNIIVSIIFLLSIVLFSYAYFTFNIDNDANLNRQLYTINPGDISIDITGTYNSNVDLTRWDMFGQDYDVDIFNRNSIITLSVNNTSNEMGKCTYDVVWTWDDGTDQYTKTSGATKEFTINTLNSSGVGAARIEETQVPNYSASSTVLGSGYILSNGVSPSRQSIVINSIFYNLKDFNQVAHAGKNYIGNVTIENVNCSGYSLNGNKDVAVSTSVNGTSNAVANRFGNYNVTQNCTNGLSVWNPKIFGLEITLSNRANNTDYSACNINYTSKVSTTYLNDYIMNLSPGACSNTSYTTASSCKNNGGTWTTTPGSGACSNPDYTTEATCIEENGDYWYGVYNENGFRYEGKKPNNYIWFNNEMWRIIGVFDEETTGLTGTRVKIIRDDVLNGLAFDKDDSNVWNGSDLQILLNDYYYYGRNNNGTNDISTYCYGYSTTTQANCDYRKEARGIKDEYRQMIENAYWKTGGFDSDIGATSMYTEERSVTGTQHYIGLMYVSDYAYSPLTTVQCPKTSAINEACASKSWLYGKSSEWIITPNSFNSSYVWSLSYFGTFDPDIFSGASTGYGVRPVLYLKSSVYYIDGDGSYENPYIIGM